jgi:DNA-binding NarL/FixJ family response regulator
MITLLLVDDVPAVRRGLKMRLTLEPDLEIVGEAGNGAEAITLTSVLHPDVVVMDVEMPGMDGVMATETLRSVEPRSRVITLSLHDDALTRARARSAGALAFVAKHEPVDILLAAIRRAAAPRLEHAN